MEFPTITSLTRSEIDLNCIIPQITLETTGASVIFSGIVRSRTISGSSRQTARLFYEAYQDMADKKLSQVALEMRKRWPSLEGIAIIQRIGDLLPGTISTVVACTASHRDSGIFEAARYGIDRVKEIVPVWKKEIGPDGEEWVEGHYHPTPGE